MLKLALRNILHRPLTTTLTLILFATGLTIMNLLVTVGDQLEEKYVNNRAGVDMVVGAKGGRLQLILSSIYHLDNPVGNINIGKAKFLFRDPRVDVIPMALGDNYKGFRIVGTDETYVNLYNGKVAEGRLWIFDFDATVGSLVAKDLNLKVGDKFAGVHGMAAEGHSHDEYQYEIVGILEPTGTVLDQLILTNIPSVWKVHGEHDDHEGHDHSGHDHGEHKGTGSADKLGLLLKKDQAKSKQAQQVVPVADTLVNGQDSLPPPPKRNLKNHYLLDYPDKEITALLVSFKGSNAILLQRYVDDETDMMSAMVELETQRLFSIIEPAARYIELLALLIVVISGLSVFISLLKSLNERKYEIALMRVNGASRIQIFLLVIAEGFILALMGFAFAFVVSHLIMFGIAGYLTEAYHYQFDAWFFSDAELNALYVAIGIGFAAALIPAIIAMRTNIIKTLTQR